MKNVNIMGVHQFLEEGRGGRVTKSNIYRELPKKGGFDNLHGFWQKNGEEGVERIDF